MLFGKPKPTVTTEDKEWIEDAFLWFEEQYGTDFLKNLRIIEPTKEFFDHNFTGTEKDAEYALKKCMEYMDIKMVNVELYFFSEAPMEFEDEGIVATQKADGPGTEDFYALGKYSEAGPNKFEIGLERKQLKNPQSMIATLAHELSHLMLLGEGRIDENNEELTDLNCIALGFGIFTSNSIFNFEQWQGSSHAGWQANRQGYIPEQAAAYAMAIFNNYQNNQTDWYRHLNKGIRKMYEKNIEYLNSSDLATKFK
ncbi:hypothetical protein [Ekhidna sp.]|uniref:hypothetical protein n=1 Tax=Ekhidna sp. TaxID=2608089 RepID=UPI0032F024D7